MHSINLIVALVLAAITAKLPKAGNSSQHVSQNAIRRLVHRLVDSCKFPLLRHICAKPGSEKVG